MGLLVNGAWQEDISRTKEGRFIRPAAAFRNFVTPDGSAGPSGEGGFAAEAERYTPAPAHKRGDYFGRKNS